MKSKYKHFLRGLGLGLVLMTSGFVQAATPNPPAGRAQTTVQDLSGKIYIDRSLNINSSSMSAAEFSFYPYEKLGQYFSGTDPKFYPLYFLNIDILVPNKLKSFNIDFFHEDAAKNSHFLFTDEANPNQSKLEAGEEICLQEFDSQTKQCEIQESTQKGKCSSKPISDLDACLLEVATQAQECKRLKENKKDCFESLEAISSKKFYKNLSDLNCKAEGTSFRCVARVLLQLEAAYNLSLLGEDYFLYSDVKPLLFQDYCNSDFKTPPNYISKLTPTQCADSFVSIQIKTTVNQTYNAVLAKQNSFYWHVNKATGHPSGEILSSKPAPQFAPGDPQKLFVGYVSGPCSCEDQLFVDCSSPTACDDHKVCTIDTCNEVTGCEYSIDVNNPACCKTSADCNDGNACNGVEQCVNNVCESGPPLSCNDNNICTQDSCSTLTNKCENKPKAGCCQSNSDCSDGNACNGVEQCVNNVCKSGQPLSCGDANICTTDSCNTVTNKCENKLIAGCCQANSDCNDGVVCTSDTCNVQTGACTNKLIQGCCQSDPACNDQNNCTADSCEQSTGKCVNSPLAQCCQTDAQCIDNNVCTVDTCQQITGKCSNALKRDCCTVDANCTDSDPCTIDSCSNNVCKHTPDKICEDLCPTDPEKTAPGICGCGVPDTDTDNDGVANCRDNCPQIANPDQKDTDKDGLGDACEPTPQEPGCIENVDFDSPLNVVPLDETKRMANTGGTYTTGEGVVISLSSTGNEIIIHGTCSNVTRSIERNLRGGAIGCSLVPNQNSPHFWFAYLLFPLIVFFARRQAQKSR